MLKIRISYNSKNELETALKLLRPIITSCRISKEDKGHFKKAYITAQENPKN